MKNLFKNTEFVFGVTDYKKLPKDIGNEILLAGRSNAGTVSYTHLRAHETNG